MKIRRDYVETLYKVHTKPSIKMNSIDWEKQTYDKGLGEAGGVSHVDGAKVIMLLTMSALNLLGS